MAGLLADGWFYISSAGLLVSGALFLFLLGQYRAATDAADQPEPEAAAEPHVPLVRPVFVPEEPVPSRKIASVAADKPAGDARRRESRGRVSPDHQESARGDTPRDPRPGQARGRDHGPRRGLDRT